MKGALYTIILLPLAQIIYGRRNIVYIINNIINYLSTSHNKREEILNIEKLDFLLMCEIKEIEILNISIPEINNKVFPNPPMHINKIITLLNF